MTGFAQAPIPDGLDLETVRITHSRGPMTRQVRDEVLRTRGSEGLRTLLEQVSPPCRELFTREIGVYEWVPLDLTRELSAAFLAQQDADYARRRGEEAARVQLSTLNTWLMKVLSPGFLMEVMPRLFRFYYRGGRMVVDLNEQGHAALSVWASGMYETWFRESLTAWTRTALQAAGAREVAIDYWPPSGEGLRAFHHQYEVRWKG